MSETLEAETMEIAIISVLHPECLDVRTYTDLFTNVNIILSIN